jgi:hypothetical protein
MAVADRLGVWRLMLNGVPRILLQLQAGLALRYTYWLTMRGRRRGTPDSMTVT